MKTLATTLGCAVCEWGLTMAWADPAADTAAAVQAIQQASDPSAAVSAYASGFAADRNNIALHNAYVMRMVDFGLPELAYHQAQLLTTLDAGNGLAWGVVAHVDARRTDMPAAITAIALAAESAPEHPFVQRTAGEIVAWYDAKGAQAFVSESSRAGIAKIRALMETRPAYTEAYNAARKAYAQRTGATPAVAEESPPDGTGPYDGCPPPPPAYDAADLYSDWGPDWVDYWPWYWWWPCGFFGGSHFTPSHRVCAFNCFHHHRFNTAWSGYGSWHHNAAGRAVFYGGMARPSPTMAASSRAAFAGHSTVAPVAGSFNTATLASMPSSPGGGSAPRETVIAGVNTAAYHGHELAIAWQSGSAGASRHATTDFYHAPPGTYRGYSDLWSNGREHSGASGGYGGGDRRSDVSSSHDIGAGNWILPDWGIRGFHNDSGAVSHGGGGGSSYGGGGDYHGGGGYHGGAGHHDGGGWHGGGGGFHGGGGHGEGGGHGGSGGGGGHR